ncbi:MAG: hypothetical protein ACM3ZT_04460 [Bacillota bacterium]
MKRFFLLCCLYLVFLLALVFLATPPDPDVSTVKVIFEYQKY